MNDNLLWLQETTAGFPRHTYLVDKKKSCLYAYIPEGKRDIINLGNNIEKGYLKFDSRNRSFKEIKMSQ